MKFRHFLTLVFFVLTLTPVLLFWAWSRAEITKEDLANAEDRLSQVARTVATALGQHHADAAATLGLLGSNTVAFSNAPQAAEAMAAVGLRQVCVYSAESGMLDVALAGETGGRCAPSLSDIDRDVLADQPPGQVMYQPVRAATDGQNALPLLLRLATGQLLLAELNTRFVRKLASDVATGNQGPVIVVDQIGQVLAHPRMDWVADRKVISHLAPGSHSLVVTPGTLIFEGDETGETHVAGYAAVSETGWGVLITEPVSGLLAAAGAGPTAAIHALLIGIAGSLALAACLSYVMTQPLKEVTATADLVSHGELALPADPPLLRFLPLEFGALVTGFRSMVLQLREDTSKINALAFVDSVTGLSNRAYFRGSVDAFVEYAGESEQASMLFLDLDGFKAINDAKGHEVGDEVLIRIADRIRDTLDLPPFAETMPNEASIITRRQQNQLARLGGDEFAIFLPGSTGEHAVRLAENLLHSIEQPVVVAGGRVSLSGSIGVSVFPVDAQDCKGLLKSADLAMYESKRGGKNQVTRFSGHVPEQTTARQKLADDLLSKDIGKQMNLEFQPVYRADDLALASIEGLTRWHHPERGLLSPEDFFETAIELGFIRHIDRMAFNRTILAAEQVTQQGLDPIAFSINMSFERLVDKTFVDAMLKRLPRACPLTIELTESSLLDALDTRAVWAIDRLKEAGVGVQLDGFGCAHASVSSLLDLRPTSIKLDHRLVERLTKNDEISVIVGSLTKMAHDLGIQVVAKGVESIEQVHICRALGCDFIQGYALNLPMSRDELFTLLKYEQARASA